MAIRRSGFSLLALSSCIFAARTAIALSIAVMAIPVLLAQQPPAMAPQGGSAQPASPGPAREEAAFTVPAGTRLALVLTHPVDSRNTRRGDEIYAQITAPVAVGSQAVIPAGTFVQGQVQKLTRKGNRGEFLMQSLSLVFPNGYVAPVEGPMNIESDEGTAWQDPSNGTRAGAFIAPAAGLGLGALIGAAAHTTQHSTLGGMTLTSGTPTGLAIGSVVGLAAGGAVALVLLARNRHFYVDVGSPMEMILPRALILPASQLAKAGQAQSPAPLVTPPAPRPIFVPRDNGICNTPGTPGSPPVVIPGTPPIGNSPGTPDIVIPGTPSTPGTSYPCPWP